MVPHSMTVSMDLLRYLIKHFLGSRIIRAVPLNESASSSVRMVDSAFKTLFSGFRISTDGEP